MYFHISFILFFFSRNFNPQSRRGTFLFSRSWSACKWIFLTCCLDFLLLLMLLKLPLLAKTSVIIILNFFFFRNYEEYMVIFLQVITFCRLIVKSCRIFDSKLLKCGGCATFKVILPSFRFCCSTIYFDFSMTDFKRFKRLFQRLPVYLAYKCV